MTELGLIGLILIVINFIFSVRGFKDQFFFDRYKFDVDRILVGKEYWRMIASGFLHSGWVHLIFNMVSLYAFCRLLESHVGSAAFLAIYFSSLFGGNLFALYIHRHHGDYSAIGASGAVCGVIFASIALFPSLRIGFPGLPAIPSGLYVFLFLAYSIYGIRSQRDNIGHEAHLGGALLGMLTAIVARPTALSDNYWIILCMTVSTSVFIYLVVTRPQILLVDNLFFKKQKDSYDIDHEFNARQVNKQNEIDRILDKINSRGVKSLTKKEKEFLEEYSK